jgi:hypothetical protein
MTWWHAARYVGASRMPRTIRRGNSRRVVAAFAVTAAWLSCATTARADGADDLPSAARTAFGFVRLDAAFATHGGSRLVGAGSRERYRAAEVLIDLDVSRFPWERIGFDLRTSFSAQSLGGGAASGGGGDKKVGRYFGMRGTLDVGVLMWGGGAPGGLVVGLGGGFDFGDRLWFSTSGRVFALTMVRARHWFSTDWHAQATWMFVPTTSAALKVREHTFELAVGWKALQLGARLDRSTVTGGDPVRDYEDTRLTAFVGACFF